MSTFIRKMDGDFSIGTPWTFGISGDFKAGVDDPTIFVWNTAWAPSIQRVWTSGGWLPPVP